MIPPVEIIEGPGPASETFFLDRSFIAFQAKAQGKRLVTFSAGGGPRGVALTLGGADGQWSSPVTGAFGGLAAECHPPAAVVFSVVEAATTWLRGEPSAISASIRLPPDGLDQPGAAVLENALHRAGWRLGQADINHHLVVGSPASFRAGLGETKRKGLRRLEHSGATAGEAGLEASRTIYDTIAENRLSVGHPMTMSWPQVEALAAAFPDHVQFFAAERGGTVLAGAICLRVTPNCLYVFYWGERPEFRKESPVTALADGLVAHAHELGIAILDVGVSTAHSAPNAGLIAFKESLGCRASSRRTYTLDVG
ncbi:MAG: hypothetical protein JWP86_3302 [Phenylobacterium sp.]|nr:hypothetical protein [Phenylobacterium sp.]MDB5495965.1 hypothetical protein [Phenylobacterium sp.]